MSNHKRWEGPVKVRSPVTRNHVNPFPTRLPDPAITPSKALGAGEVGRVFGDINFVVDEWIKRYATKEEIK